MNNSILLNKCIRVSAIAVAIAVASSLAAPVFAQDFFARQNPVGRLFFTAEERNVLEAVRQGIVDPRILRTEDDVFIATQIELPDIIFKVRKNEETNTFAREQLLKYGGIIRKSNSESADIFINGSRISPNEVEQLETELGIKFRTDRDDGAVLLTEDVLFKNNISLRRGDIIEREGQVINSNSNKRFILVKSGS